MNSLQSRRIMEYLENHESISQAEAVERFRCYRLSARIWDLRAEGNEIETIMEESINEDGNRVRYARYRLRRKVCEE